jgi:hypothetical protein
MDDGFAAPMRELTAAQGQRQACRNPFKPN